MCDNLPSVENEFARRREAVPSIYCYHGTGYDCLYSLMRNGLRNLSNSRFMTTGAAYGSGIYIAPNFATASGYTKPCSVGQYGGRGYNYHQQ